MAFGMRRQFAAWMPARAQAEGSDDDDDDNDDDDDDLSPSGRVRLASMLLFRLVSYYVHAEGLS